MRQGHGQRDGQLVQDGAWHKMLGPAHARAAIEHRPSLNRLRDVMKVLRYTQHIISTDLQTERLSTALRLTTRYRKRAGVPFIIWAFDWIQPPPHGRREEATAPLAPAAAAGPAPLPRPRPRPAPAQRPRPRPG